MNSERKIDIMYSFMVSFGLFFIGMVFTCWADVKKYEYFGIDARGTQQGDELTNKVDGLGSKKGSNFGLPFRI